MAEARWELLNVYFGSFRKDHSLIFTFSLVVIKLLLFQIETIKNIFNSMLIDANKEATLMKSAPNGPVHVLEDPSKTRNILDYMKKDRLLVLNFGSST